MNTVLSAILAATIQAQPVGVIEHAVKYTPRPDYQAECVKEAKGPIVGGVNVLTGERVCKKWGE